MKKLLLILVFIFSIHQVSNAYEYASGPNGQVASALDAQVITDALATHQRCRAVYIGTAQTIDISLDGSTWKTFQGLSAGSILPVQAVGARITAGNASPASGDVVFLY